MKKYAMLNRLIFLCSFNAFFAFNVAKAQRFHAGFSMGVTATDIDQMDTRGGHDDFHKLGYTFGGIVNTSTSDKNTFQLELNYIKKGSSQPPDSLNNGYYKLAVDYVDMAVLFRRRIHFNFKKKNITQFGWEAGVSLGRMVRHTWVIDNYPYEINLNSLNMTDVSLFGGIDYNFSPTTCFCIRYSNSVIPVLKHDVIPSYLYTRLFNAGNNMAFQFSFKFVFGNKVNDNN